MSPALGLCCELLENHVPLDVVTTPMTYREWMTGCELLENHVPLDVVTTGLQP